MVAGRIAVISCVGLIDTRREREREKEKERERERERERSLLNVSKYNALSGNTASGRSGPSI
jgi:hypothetical protein